MPCVCDSLCKVMSSQRIVLFSLLIAAAYAYDIGVLHTYRYETFVAVDEVCQALSEDSLGYKLQADISLTAVWQDPKNVKDKLMKIQVPAIHVFVPKKSSFEERKSELQKIPPSDSFFLLKNGKVEKFWDNPSEHLSVRNLKRSVASLLQMKRENGEETQVDVSGTCKVFYKIEGNTIRRSKTNCYHPAQDSVSSQPHGVRSLSVSHVAGIDCELREKDSSVVSGCMTTEQVKSFSNLWEKSSICIQSTSQFLLEGSSSSKDVFKNQDLNNVIEEIKKNQGSITEGDLLAISEKEKEESAPNVMDSTKSFQESLKESNLAKLKSASAFFKLLPIYRKASKAEIIKVLETKKFSSIQPQILDLLAASSTQTSVDAALSYFSNAKGYNENFERYLISLSVIPRAEAFHLKEIKSCLEKGNHHEKIEATLITTLGSLLRTYARSDNVDSKVVKEVLEYLETSLEKCKNEDCVLRYLRGLRNAAQLESVPALAKYALKGGKPALEALLAFRNMPSVQFSGTDQQMLLKIFHQVGKKQDRSARALAAEILLLGKCGNDVLKSILSSLSDQSDLEFSTFVASKLFALMDENKELRSRVLRILPEKQIAHYYSLSQKGKSSLFRRPLIETDSLNATFGIEMELLEGGLLKRSSFDVDFRTSGEVSNLLSVGMFAEGMGSFVGEDPTGEGLDPMAGMELTVLGTSLRPYIFFSSTSELMSHAWSGTASEPTPALQGIFSLSDDDKQVILHNGVSVKLELRAAISTDLSAAIQISLWNRDSQSQVKKAAALLQRGSATVDANVVKAKGEYLFYGQSSIDFITDSEVYEAPFKMCLQMEHPDILLRHDFQKSVEMVEANFSKKKTKKRKRHIPSRSYALNQNNNDMCRIMKAN